MLNAQNAAPGLAAPSPYNTCQMKLRGVGGGGGGGWKC